MNALKYFCPLAAVILALALAGCVGDKPPVAAGAFIQVFQSRGTVQAVRLTENAVAIQHPEIPGVLPAQTTVFSVKTAAELAGLKAGEAVTFQLIITPAGSWVAQLRKY